MTQVLTQSKARDGAVVHRLDAEMVAADQVVLCDLDGCLVSSGRAYADSEDFLRGCGARLWIVSNNSTHTAAGLSTELSRLGLNVPASRILLAGEETLRHMAEAHPGARLAVFGSPEMERLASELGFDTAAGVPEIALLCRDTQLSLSRLDALTAALLAKASLWVSNIDPAHPGRDGHPVAETGALLAAVEAILGRRPFTSIGKPDPHMVRIALTRSGIAAHDAVFIGDSPQTDGAVADAAGLRFIRLDREGETE